MTPLLATLAALALIPAYIAARKRVTHRNEVAATYYVFGLLLLVAAIPAAIWFAKDERRRCPICAERIQDEALKCPHCHVTIGRERLRDDGRPDMLHRPPRLDELP